MVGLATVGVVATTGCTLPWKKNKDTIEESDLAFAFSVGLKSGANVISVGSNESVVVYDNGIDTAGRSYTYSSSDPEVATVDSNGKITAKKAGTVNFLVKEANSNKTKALKKAIEVIEPVSSFSGGANYSSGTKEQDLKQRAEILGKLEKYVMDTHLTGITLFDNGGYVRYSDRVVLPTDGEYIEGYGFGLLAEGRLNGTLSGEEGKKNPTYLHEAIAQDSLKINQYTATGSQVGDLASYITSSYWSTKLTGKTGYDWYPCLAADKVKAPDVDNGGYKSEAPNTEPIAMDKSENDLHKKWRIYVKTDGVKGANLKFTQKINIGDKNNPNYVAGPYNNVPVTLDDYVFAYELLLTGSNNIIRGTEMANDSSYGIKGAQRYFNESKGAKTEAEINAKWAEFTTPDANGNTKLGLQWGRCAENGLDYLDIELINPIDSFTAMYTLSSSLVSPIPRKMFLGANAIAGTMKDAASKYGTFNNEDDDAILNYTVCVGPFTLAKWAKNQEIVYERNDNWFEHAGDARYHIPGVDYRIIDTSTDTEKVWKQLEAGNLDSAGVPSKKTQEWKDRTDKNVFPTKGDSTFKLNVNSCTQEQWNELFGPTGKWPAQGNWDVKPWMSNHDFLDGLFYSINRQQFAEKRGVTPSINYFSDAYQMRGSTFGQSYNQYDAHKKAVAGYSDNYGYSFDKAVDCFRSAVQQLSRANKLVLGPDKDHPTEISIHIRWMYQTDINEYGDDIKYYFETAFNDPSVCGGKVKLKVEQDAVTNWEDVYNVWMMQGRFDLGFGAIAGNTYNPLNFLEVLKSDNSSSFTLNWGADTSKVDEKNAIVFDGKKWSFDALWEVADHGGLVENGEKIKPVRSLTAKRPTTLGGERITDDKLNKGFKLTLPVDFAEYDEEGKRAVFDVNRFDVYVIGDKNITLAEKGDGNITYNKTKKTIEVTVTQEKAQEVEAAIKTAKGWDKQTFEGDKAWQNEPFLVSKLNDIFTWELYYEMSINGGAPSINFGEITNANE